MRSSSVIRSWRVAVYAGTCAALAAAALAIPTAHAATPAPGPVATSHAAPSSRPARLVTLLTGDRVRITRDSSGRLSTSLAPGSPHYGEPVQTVDTPGHAWVVPRLSLGLRRRLDPAVFDVLALARTPRVSLRVTFARGASPRNLPGLPLRRGGVRHLANGRTTALTSYDARRPLPTSLVASLRGVVGIAPATRVAPTATPAYQLHRMTINVTDAGGSAVPVAGVVLVNTDRPRLFDAFGVATEGQWKVAVPQGHYLAFVSDPGFHYALVGQANVVDADVELDLSVADATMSPDIAAPPGFVRNSGDVSVLGFDGRHRRALYSVGFAQADPKLTPQPRLTDNLVTEVSNTWTPRGSGATAKAPVTRIVMSKILRRGIPQTLRVPYQPSRYADVRIKSFATGAEHERQTTTMYALDPRDNSLIGSHLRTERPGVLHARLLGGKNLGWFVAADSYAGHHEVGMESLAQYDRGQHVVVPLFRGPLTPFVDRDTRSPKVFGVNGICPICVVDGALTGFAPLISSAGTDHVGDNSAGRFALFRGHRRLAHGVNAIRTDVPHVSPGEPLRLVTTSTSPSKRFTLSSRVHDVWNVRVPRGRRAMVPLLRAAYVPPTTLHSIGHPGRVRFPITFDNVGPVAARIDQASLDWSVDGQHWHAARLVRRDKNTFAVSYRAPLASAAHRYLSLRVHARDAAGRTVSESVQNAYLLPGPHGVRKSGVTAAGGARRSRGSLPRKVCGAPSRHHYTCYVELSRRTLANDRGAAAAPKGWGATALRQAYGIAGFAGATTTIGVIDAFGYPHAEADLNKYRARYGLGACTTANGCFTKLNQDGQPGPYPKPDPGWGVETALDLQMVSVACPTCHIVLVETDDNGDSLENAEQTAVRAGATVTSHSFGITEGGHQVAQRSLYDKTGVTAVASTGDSGWGLPNFPASSPDVVAVGGTVLSHATGSPRGWAEKVWDGASSGCSAYFDKPDGQQDPACPGRTVADLSAVASNLAIYDTSLPKRQRGWFTVNGTSASTPLVAGMIAAAGGGGLRPSDLYALDASAFHDVTSGANGFCQRSYLCTGVPGYDGPTGLGTPTSPEIFAPAP